MTVRIHASRDWRRRRLALIARTAVCEWCGRVFGGKVVAAVHHISDDYHPRIGVGDEERYLAMKDDEVVVICNGCHYFWHKFRLKPGDPLLTCACGRWKEPQFEICKACWLATQPETNG